MYVCLSVDLMRGLLRPLPVAHADRLYALPGSSWGLRQARNGREFLVSSVPPDARGSAYRL
jgi:hypothetical protein